MSTFVFVFIAVFFIKLLLEIAANSAARDAEEARRRAHSAGRSARAVGAVGDVGAAGARQVRSFHPVANDHGRDDSANDLYSRRDCTHPVWGEWPITSVEQDHFQSDGGVAGMSDACAGGALGASGFGFEYPHQGQLADALPYHHSPDDWGGHEPHYHHGHDGLHHDHSHHDHHGEWWHHDHHHHHDHDWSSSSSWDSGSGFDR